MKKIITATSFLLIFTNSLFAQTIPSKIEQRQNELVEKQICQNNWKDYLNFNIDFTEINLGPQEKLYFLPCSHWAVNMTYVAHHIDLANNQTKSLDFLLITPFKKEHPSVLTHNIQWQQEDHLLLSIYRAHTRSDCGTKTLYQWNSTAKSFDVMAMLLKEDCYSGDAQWQRIK